MSFPEALPGRWIWTQAGGSHRLAKAAGNLDYGVILPLLGRLPLPLAYWLSDRRGDVLYCLRGQSKRASLSNCASVLPDRTLPEIRTLVRRHYRTRAGDEVESYWYDRPLAFWEPRMRIQGLERLREGLAGGDGGLLYTAHLGSATLLVTHLGKMGLPVCLVSRRVESVPGKPFAWYRQGSHRVEQIQRAIGQGLLYAGGNGYFRMRRLLRAGMLLVVAVDVPPATRRPAPVTLFGRRALLERGLAKLYLDTRTPSFFFSSHPTEQRIHVFQIEEITESLERAKSETGVVQELASRLERAVLRNPQDWSQWEALQHFLDPENSFGHETG